MADFAKVIALAGVVACLVAVPAAQAPPRGKSAATIAGTFADSCRDFAASSSKDISYVDVQYVSGLRIKDESITSHDYVIDGGVSDGIAFAIVKSGTTTRQFDCEPSNTAPTAVLEIKTPPMGLSFDRCFVFFAGGLLCEQSSPRTAWTRASQIPDNGGGDSGLFHWGCGFISDLSQCSMTISFRGISSADPDADITSWSLDFGDGTSANGSWSTAPPTEIAHQYLGDVFGGGDLGCGDNGVCIVTLTVTDSAGQSSSDVIRMVFLNQSPG